MIKITPHISISAAEIHFTFTCSPGPGGQNVNKVATAAQLRFNVLHSPSLPEDMRQRVLIMNKTRISLQGELLIKASRFRTQERNKQDALQRLTEILKQAATPPKKRKKTKPTYSSAQRRLSTKKLHGKTKSLRSKKANYE